jgi:hypothetical protein
MLKTDAFSEALAEASISIACALDEAPSTEDLEHIQSQITTLENLSGSVAQYIVRDVYGEAMLYPENKLAHFLCDLAGTKTLTDRTRQLAKDFGVEFEQAMREV